MRNAALQLCPAAVQHSSIQIPPTLASRAHILYFGQTVPRFNKYALLCSCSALFIVLMPGDVRCNSCGTRTRVKLQIALFALLLLHSAVSPLQISWRDATCPPPPGAGGKFNDSNGSLKESGLISHSTGTGHHPQSRHQTLISFYSIPTAKTQCSRREDKKALGKRVTFQDGCVMGPVGMSLKMCLFFFSIGWRGARGALSQTCRGTFCLSLQPLLLARMSFGLTLRAFVSNSVFNTSRIPASRRVPITTAFAHRAKHGR